MSVELFSPEDGLIDTSTCCIISDAPSSSNLVDVWVSGDGGHWSCLPSKLYQIPTSVFDYYMLIGRLNTQEDLEILISQIAENKTDSTLPNDNEEYTEVWISHGGNWSGSRSLHYQLPIEVFDFLQETTDTSKTIGGLTSLEDLDDLIERTRVQMSGKSIEISMDDKPSTLKAMKGTTEIKHCGHTCSTSSVKETCCSCSDRRPIRTDGMYPLYIDGVGWANKSSRGAGYCPMCKY
jgi:hypothetical protein